MKHLLILAGILSTAAHGAAALVDVRFGGDVLNGKDCQQKILEHFKRLKPEDIHVNQGQRKLTICLPTPQHYMGPVHPFIAQGKYYEVECIAAAIQVEDPRCP